MNFREAQSSEYETIAGWIVAVEPWKDTYKISKEVILGLLQDLTVFVATINNVNEPVAAALLDYGGSFTVYIKTLIVREDCRGRGIGGALLTWCEKEQIFGKGHPNAWIAYTKVVNERAGKLYRRLGFVDVGPITSYLRDGVDEQLLRKSNRPKLEPFDPCSV